MEIKGKQNIAISCIYLFNQTNPGIVIDLIDNEGQEVEEEEADFEGVEENEPPPIGMFFENHFQQEVQVIDLLDLSDDEENEVIDLVDLSDDEENEEVNPIHQESKFFYYIQPFLMMNNSCFYSY